MRALVQRVREAAVYLVDRRRAASASGGAAAAGAAPSHGAIPADQGSREAIGRIGAGFTVLLGVGRTDTPEDARTLAARVAALRVFDDEMGRLNRSVVDVGGEVLSIPQFTLYADTAGGRRPSFINAAPPEQAEPLYRLFNDALAAAGIRVVPGRFRTRMIVEIHNDGPVTLMLETRP